jgi:hypothetical protein
MNALKKDELIGVRLYLKNNCEIFLFNKQTFTYSTVLS